MSFLVTIRNKKELFSVSSSRKSSVLLLFLLSLILRRKEIQGNDRIQLRNTGVSFLEYSDNSKHKKDQPFEMGDIYNTSYYLKDHGETTIQL